MLKLLYPLGSLLPLFLLQQPLKIRPRGIQTHLIWRSKTFGRPNPIIQDRGIPAHLQKIDLQSCHRPSHNHPRVRCSL